MKALVLAGAALGAGLVMTPAGAEAGPYGYGGHRGGYGGG